MFKKILSLIALVVALAVLYTCGKSDEDEAAKPQNSDANITKTVDETIAPSAEYDPNKPDIIDAMKENAGVMSEQEIAEAIQRARLNAETAAKKTGQNAEQIKQAGDAAEAVATKAFAVEGDSLK